MGKEQFIPGGRFGWEKNKSGRFHSLRITIAFFCILLGMLPATATAQAVYTILPESIHLDRKGAVHQLLLESMENGLATGDRTNNATWTSSHPEVASIDENGRITALSDGQTTITATLDGTQLNLSVSVTGCQSDTQWSFKNDVLPVLTKKSCNSGACHGALAGKNGFALSLRGYDPQGDYFTLTRQANGRRVLLADPEQSLMLLKPTAQISHGGGAILRKEDTDYDLLLGWLLQGAPAPRSNERTVVSIEVHPKDIRLALQEKQQLVVLAHFDDGSIRDVTRWAKFDTTNDAVAIVDENGLARVQGSGSAALTVWYSSKVTFARLMVPRTDDLPDTVFTAAERFNYIDEAILNQLQTLRIAPSSLADDTAFVRRAYLDALGILPSPDEISRFVLDRSPDKRRRLIDWLLQREEYVDQWSYKWSDLLLVSSKKLPREALQAFYAFIRQNVKTNTGWDEFVRRIITAQGSTVRNGAANFFVLHKESTDLTETTSQAFLGMSITCARCHNHPMEKWTQDDYYGMANLLARIQLKNGLLPGEIQVLPVEYGDVIHPRRGIPMPPKPLDAEPMDFNEAQQSRREYLARWLTSPDNPYFTRAIINRVWKQFMGRGLVEPEDDLRLTNPPSNEPLFAALEKDFISHGYDIKHLIRTIMNSAAYQRSSEPYLNNGSDDSQFSRYYIRRLSAEVILDAYSKVTGAPTRFDGYPEGWRALQLPDTNIASGFLQNFGRPERNQTCSCERQTTPTLIQALDISNGDTLNDKLRREGNTIDRRLTNGLPLDQIILDLYLNALGRTPSTTERDAILELAGGEDRWTTLANAERREILEDVYWAVLSGKEFLFNH